MKRNYITIHIDDILQLEDWLEEIHQRPATSGSQMAASCLKKLADIKMQNGVDPYFGKRKPWLGVE